MADIADAALESVERSEEEIRSVINRNRKFDKEALENLVEKECVECGEIIPMKRLLIVPRTKLCIDCQNMAEKRH